MDEPDGFAEFAAARYPALLRMAHALTGDPRKAQDLAQTALMRMWPHWSRISRDGDPWAYLRKIVLSTQASWWRRSNLVRFSALQSLEPAAVEDAFALADTRADLRRWLADLPARQRAVIVARYLLDMSVEQTADALHCSAGTVKSQTSKALSQLRANRLLEADQDKEDASWPNS